MSSQVTLFEELVDEVFLKNLKNVKRPVTIRKSIGDCFYIMSNASKQQPKTYQYYFHLEDHYIFVLKSKESQEEIAYMDIKYAFLKLNRVPQTISGKKLYSLKFIKKKTYEELFCEDLNQAVKWFDKMKNKCILTKFRQDYDSMSVLGRGNFAKVY